MATGKFQTHAFSIVVALFTVVFLIVFAIFGRYSAETQPLSTHDFANVSRNAPLLHDTHAFVLIGFGFLVAFLRRAGFTALSFNLLILAWVLEWGLIVRGFMSTEFAQHGYFTISLRDFVKADYTAAAVLISFGALVGKLSPIQYVALAIIETPVQVINEHIVLNYIQAGDVGGSIVVHLFGAVFGLAASRLLFKPSWAVSEHLGSIYHSDIFSFVGTVFLWAFFPSFNSIFAITAAEQQRSVLNTFLALIASTITTFLVSQLVTKDHRFNIKHIASASLAGGVAAGTVSTLILAPFPALLVGVIAGAASVLSFQHLTPALGKKFNFHDTRGVFSLHGIPAIVGVLASVVLLFIVPVGPHGEAIRNIYTNFRTDRYQEGYDAAAQALRQLGALFLTLVIALISGALTGVILKLSLWAQVREKEAFADADFFQVTEDYDFTTNVSVHLGASPATSSELNSLSMRVERKQLLANDAAVIPTTVTTTA
ncbi:Ammonium-transp domain-containing protein [Aphelenchoides fujianensis]|nr:Ammonium-transp domain-containing protein [Aphelenchoides fujianensis]